MHFLPVAVIQTRIPTLLSVRAATWPGRRLDISSAILLLNARDRTGWAGSARAIISSVDVFAAPARAEIRIESLLDRANSIMACCSVVGVSSIKLRFP